MKFPDMARGIMLHDIAFYVAVLDMPRPFHRFIVWTAERDLPRILVFFPYGSIRARWESRRQIIYSLHPAGIKNQSVFMGERKPGIRFDPHFPNRAIHGAAVDKV